MRWFLAVAIVAVLSVCCASTAHAGAVMQINGGTTYLFQNEVHPISSPTVSVAENGNGNPDLVNPLLLIIGIPNITSFAAPTLTLSAGTADIGGGGSGNAFGASYSPSTGLATNNGGMFNSGEVYSFLGLTSGGNNSNSFSNWAAWDSQVNGLSASGFGMFVYELTGTGMTGGQSVTATFKQPIPVGTFVVAYGEDANGNVFSTPFTQTGLSTGGNTPFSTPTPEPASLVMLGTGLAALYARRRRGAGL